MWVDVCELHSNHKPKPTKGVQEVKRKESKHGTSGKH